MSPDPEITTGEVVVGGPADATSATVRSMFGEDSLYLVLWTSQIVLTAVFTPVTTRLVGQAAFGLIGTSLALMSLLTGVVGFGLQTGVQRAYAGPDGEDGARRVVGMALLLTLVSTGILYATGPWWSNVIGLPGFPTTIRFAVIYAGASAVTYCTLSLLRSRGQLGVFATVTLTQSILAECLAVGLVLTVARHANWYMLGEMLAQVVAAVIGLAAVRPKWLRRVDLAPLWAVLRFSAALVPETVAGFVLAASDRLVVQGDLGPRAAAHYNVASNIGGFAVTILAMLDVIWLPRILAIDDRETRRTVLDEAASALAVMVVAVAATIALASPLILLLWAPPSYDPGRLLLVVSLVAASAVPFALARLPIQGLLVVGRTGVVAVLSIACAGLNFGLNLMFVPDLGIRASAGATLVAFAVEMVAVWRVARVEMAAPGLRRTLAVAVGCATVVATAAIPASGLFIVVRVVLTFAAVAVFAGQAAQVLAPDLLSRLGARLRRLGGFARD